ncbi:dephospho-CoA kinase [Verrucomicrobiaceae bacterium 5K15]|uniref:Dephospho-CoA kinase n=1 Tax=Oceaniferula flava TaxID=2800421 RepID=A0AAE2S9Z0_9BACT|nr:dephospho-CoA kinase [Oceaniferula flavus]MBK1853624.1 dephospho-CoA kinase [Oceaniferula flavus]MBM1134929.1 dephospho-CoA kinase [Oceaniferula flavus]
MTNSQLTILGLSGGIATGKSTCAKVLLDLLPETVLFDADACVRDLYQRDTVLRALAAHFGDGLFSDGGEINKGLLRERAFSNPADKQFLEDLFHPLVRQECLALLAQTVKNSQSRLFVADVPLLFENGFDFGQSTNLLVATSRNTQVNRLRQRNNWDANTVQSVLSSQMPIESKFALADVVIWNEGPVKTLRSQCRRYLNSLNLNL